jgi:hypothetical protein
MNYNVFPILLLISMESLSFREGEERCGEERRSLMWSVL